MRSLSSRPDLTQGPVGRHLIRMSVPMLWGILAMIGVQLADTFYISRLGTDALAAIGFTFPVTMTVFSLIIGMCIAVSSVLSRLAGAKREDALMATATHGILLAVILGGLSSVVGLLLLRPLFRTMGADATLMPMIIEYMSVWFLGCAVMAVPLVGNSAMRALGDTLTPAFIMMGLSMLNAVLAAVLVFGLLGAPRMGIRGAALATVLSYIVAACASLGVLYFRKKLIFQRTENKTRFADSAKALLAVAIPVGLASIIQPVAQGLIIAILSATGAAATVAAFGVATRVEAMAFVVIIALATGMSPIIGQNWGAGRHDRVKETLKRAMVFSTFWSLGVAVILALCSGEIARLFSADPAVIHDTALYFLIVPFSYALGNLVTGWGSAFNAMGKAKTSLMMIVVRQLVLQIPLAYVGGHFFGAVGVFAALAAVNVGTGLFFHLRYWPALGAAPETLSTETKPA